MILHKFLLFHYLFFYLNYIYSIYVISGEAEINVKISGKDDFIIIQNKFNKITPSLKSYTTVEEILRLFIKF